MAEDHLLDDRFAVLHGHVYAMEELLLNVLRMTRSDEEIQDKLLPLLEELMELAERETHDTTSPMSRPAFLRGSRESWTFFLDNLRKLPFSPESTE